MATVSGTRRPYAGMLWLLVGALYLFLPLLATGLFSLSIGRGRFGLDSYAQTLLDPEFYSSLGLSLRLALLTILLALIIVVPTVVWVVMRLPKAKTSIEFLSALPFVVPPIVLVTGLLRGFRWAPAEFYASEVMLVVGYVVLALPYVYRSLDNGLRGIDLRTLVDAAQTLGAKWPTTVWRVVLPNIRSSLVSASLLTLAVVMGEFTMALLLLFRTYPVHMSYVWESRATGAAALSLISFAITWIAMLGILLVGQRLGRHTVQVGGTR